MTLLTPEQGMFIQDMIDKGIKFRLEISRYHEIPNITIYVWDAKNHRKFFLHLEHEVKKESSFDKTITGKVKYLGMNINLWDWDKCKVVGTVTVIERIPVEYVEQRVVKQVTDCDLREGKYSDAQVRPLQENI